MKSIAKKLKLHLILATATILVVPILSVVACAKAKKSPPPKQQTGYYVQNVKPLNFEDIFQNQKVSAHEPIYYRGINQTAYIYGTSLVLNILRGLGWHYEDTTKTDLLYDPNFNFDTVRASQATKSRIKLDHIATPFEKSLSSIFKKSSKNGLYEFIAKTTKSKPVSKLYNQIKALVYVDKNSANLEKVDCSTEVVINLSGQFQTLNDKAKRDQIARKLNTMSVLNKIFNDQKYAYTWSGNLLSKLGFQIQGDKLIVWHISDKLPQIYKDLKSIRAQSQKLETHLETRPLEKKDQKLLSQVALDPFGVSGEMGYEFFISNTNLKNLGKVYDFIKPSPWYDDKTYAKLLQEENLDFNNLKMIKDNHFSKAINWNAKHYGKNGNYNWAGKDNKNWKQQKVAAFNSFLDAKKPGTVILKMYNGRTIISLTSGGEVNYPLKTIITQNRIKPFYTLKNKEKIEQMADLVYRFIKFLQTEVQKKNEQIEIMEKMLPPSIKAAFAFLRNNEISKAKVYELFREYNNGSHYMLAVEIFLRGMTNIPTKLLTNFAMRLGVKLYLLAQGKEFSRKPNHLVGMVNVNSILPFLFLCYTAQKVPKKGVEWNFDPKTADYLDRAVYHMMYFQYDLEKYRLVRQGKEIQLYEL